MRNFNARLHLVFLFFIALFSFLIARLVYLQIFKSSEFKAYAFEQHNIFTEIQPLRGNIFDRNFKELAINAVSYSIFATNKAKLEAEEQSKLSSILDEDIKSLRAKLNSEKSFIWLKRNLSPDVSARLKDLNVSGIGQVRERKRFYPNGTLASQIIGFTDIDNKGLEGLEFYYDSYLSGIKGWRLANKDAKRRELICWGYKSILPADGYDLVLTIDSVIQNIAKRHTQYAARKYKAASATAIVMQPKTGEILALYNYPDYDLNDAADCRPEARRNLAVTGIFEPGSSFKFVTAAAVIEEGLVKPEDKFFCEKGRYRIGARLLHDYKPYGNLSFKEVMQYSSNIGIVKAAQLLKKDTLCKYIGGFGFGVETGVGLPGEAKGIVKGPDEWSGASISSISMGYEVAVTPMQLICGISTLANDGILLKPRILKSIRHKDGRIIKSFPRQQVRQVISRQSAASLREILTACVEEGTGKKARVSGYKAAGKTGTARKASPQGGYCQGKYFASFVGFVPAEDPVISIIVVLNEPRPQYFGGTVAAPVFRKIASETLRYLEMSNETKKVN